MQIGERAPDFTAKIQDGSEVKLSDYLGKKVVLYFYPKDNTPGCTTQSCNLRDNYELLQEQGYVVLGISTDTEKSHVKFIEKFDLPFDLISDPDKKVHDLYGTWAEKQMYGRKYMGTVRITFVIDEHGVCSEVIKKVVTKDHTSQVIK